MRFLFVLIIIFILILSCRKHSAHFQFFRLKKKIKNNPSISIKQEDNSYNYKEGGYTVSYRVKESPSGLSVEWLYFKRRLKFIEKNVLDIKRSTDKFFISKMGRAIAALGNNCFAGRLNNLLFRDQRPSSPENRAF